MILSTESRKELINAAFQAKEHAYFPHSRFRVGAALMCSDSTIVKGSSIDNAAYGASTCAEQSAIVSAISEGKRGFNALAIVSDAVTPISPCGICRQIVREFCHVDMPVLLVPGDYSSRSSDKENGNNDGMIEETVGGLLPHSLDRG